ncbi:MAG: oxaloacetate decarboxylase (Na+ extruding) subunit alpha [Gaiellales bacterium]|nr:oxaloacetate decarboxylase (Na+ extruding) subunit alpha [Gaiellales bacterium]
MTRFVDTTLRLLSQDPLARTLSSGTVLRLAEKLDAVGYSALEVTGGGCFTTAVDRGLESPWERIRAVRGRTRTPLAMALRGTFLVGGRPAADDLVRRFVLCAAESGIDVFRMHDPLNDIDDLAVPAAAVREAGARLYAGLVYSDGPEGHDYLLEHARRLSDMGADRILLQDPAGALDPAAAGELIRKLITASGVPVGLYAQGPGGTALAVAIEAARAGADPIATASYPVAMLTTRPAAELLGQALSGLGFDAGIDREKAWEAAREIEAALGDAASSAPPVSPHVALRAALATVPIGVVAGIERSLRAAGAEERLDEVLDELLLVRAESGYPPPASPVGRILAGQAIRHVLHSRRWSEVDGDMRSLLLGEWGHAPAPVDPVALAAAERAPASTATEPSLEDAREEAGSLAASEEDLCLVAVFGDRALPLLQRLRGRETDIGDEDSLDDDEARRVRRLVRLLEESDAGELTVEEDGVRITVRRREAGPSQAAPLAAPVPAAPAPAAPAPAVSDVVLVESPMVGNFFRASSPDKDPFVEVGDRVEVGQTLCILEAMKLFNEFKSDHAGTVRKVLVDDAQPVEFGQPLFELAPL